MARFRKKPVVIEAWEFDGRLDFSKTLPKEIKDNVKLFRLNGIGQLLIQTLEGEMKADYGDFIIKGVNGEYYPCKPDIFEKTYEKVEE